MEEVIKKIYPGSKEGWTMTRSCINDLQKNHGFDLENTILGTSVCSDEIVRTATNFRDYLGNESPFSLGGLGGFPFTGITGFIAFSGHIPDNGFAIIEYGPHIGVSKNGTVGSVRRIGQALETTCCGALKVTVNKLKDEGAVSADPELDYQQWKLETAVSENRDNVLKAENPLVAATDAMYSRIDQRIKHLLDETSEYFRNTTVALVGGIIINTDHGLNDWFDLREFSVHKF
jgi:hypothetical protein